ncbi:S-adenosyl-L-methionine-dependent methyltransferase [Rhizopus microsporus var. microsporus]|uniref:S-adenosyl-L-methionine-dependent methyltransferase n=1 Tax=Rhizopus microsporus var. microsporus TaxID=86635 RepID=A0A1X0QUH0_RHIZD|nr:S-adenosyl-L-methionine-dependent methyltransferase [Rhizopus microsporus var. microsporus]
MGNAQSSGDNEVYPTIVPKKKPPTPYNFFDIQHTADLPSPTRLRKESTHTSSARSHTSNSNKSVKDTSNYFEMAAVAHEPSLLSKTSSPRGTTPASSIKKSYTQSSSQMYQLTPTSSRSSSTKTINTQTEKKKPPSNVSDHLMIDGRTYSKNHASKNFMLPCDDDEADRLMTMHYILKAMFQWNFISPIHESFSSGEKLKVLDIGCGPGTWIMEMATEYPNSDFYGLDECSLFPASIKPANAHFQIHDILKGPLPFEDEMFDFVYMRSMMIYLLPEELATLLSEIHRVMKPGAYLEVVDTNYTIRRAGPLSNSIINTELKQKMNPVGHVNTVESNTHHPIFTFLMMTQDHTLSFLGHFVDITQEHVAIPVGNWTGQQLDTLHTQNVKSFLSTIHLKERRLTTQEINEIIDECGRYNSYLDYFACYARKPSRQDNLEQNTIDSINEFVQGFVDI